MQETVSQFTVRVDNLINMLRGNLKDSPKSLNYHIINNIGFYQGFCAAKCWDWDMSAILKWEALITDE